MADPILIDIATTGGPSTIRAAEFDSEAQQSAMVLFDQNHVPMGVDPFFDAFERNVRKYLRGKGAKIPDGGLILEVDRQIDAGSSWQLGVLMVDLLLSQRKLALREADAKRLFWLTGEIGTHRWTAKSVEGVSVKLEKSRARLMELMGRGIAVEILVPTGNLHEAKAAAPDGAEVRAVSSVDALIKEFAGLPGAAADDVLEDEEETPKRNWAKAAGFGVVGLAAAGAAAFWGLSDDRTKRAVLGWAMAPQITGPEPESASEPLPLLTPGNLAYRPATPDTSGVPAALRLSPELAESDLAPGPRPRLPTFAAIEIASNAPPPMLGGGRVTAERDATVPDGLGALTPPLILAASLAVPPDLLDGARTLPAFEIEPEPVDRPEVTDPTVEPEGAVTESETSAEVEGTEPDETATNNGQTIDEAEPPAPIEGQTSENTETATETTSAVEPEAAAAETATEEPSTETTDTETAATEPETTPTVSPGATQTETETTGTEATGTETTETAAVPEPPLLSDPALKLYLLVAPPGLNCLALSFNNAEPIAKAQPLTGPQTEIEIGGDVCGAEFRIEADAQDPRALVISHRFAGGMPPAVAIQQDPGQPSSFVLALKPRARLRGPAAMDVEARWTDSRGALTSGSQNIQIVLRPGLGGF